MPATSQTFQTEAAAIDVRDLTPAEISALLFADAAFPSAAPIIPPGCEVENGPHRELTADDIKAEELRDHWRAKYSGGW